MNFKDNTSIRRAPRSDSFYLTMIICAAMCAIMATFVLANSGAEVETKTRGFSGIIAAFLVICICLHLWQTRRASPALSDDTAPEGESRTDLGLRGLDEANQFFSGSIKRDDMFRLVSSRLRDLLPFRTCSLLLLDETRSHLRVAEANGVDADAIRNLTFNFNDGPVGKCFSGRSVEISHTAASSGIGFIAAVPLLHANEAIGVLHFSFDPGKGPGETDISLFEAIGVRVAPLVLSSLALERSLTNALTDAITDLPNERAFYLILENQIAEAQRKPDKRPLTILAIDIKNFDDINQRFGHAAGDHVLSFVAQAVKDNLRQMDFLARSLGDEFLAILPTASKEISHEVIARIHTGLFGRKIKMGDGEPIEVNLNFGWAAFGTDGETPNSLLAAARLRKEQSKSAEPPRVLWFPQELVN